jgi:LPXTG-site transpeptidase (sortase) family protein
MKKNFENKINDIFSEKSKNIWKFLIIIFILNVIVLNWSDIYWLFNPKVAPKGIQTLISQEEKIEEEILFYNEEDSIKISKIQITAPIVFSNPVTDKDFDNALKVGVVHFPESDLPGEKGTTIILGHSAPPGWPKIDYEWVFSDLEKLEKGDSIDIYYKNRLYQYIVEEKVILEIGDDVPSYNSNESELVLLSCWPPGKNLKRIGVRGVLTK